MPTQVLVPPLGQTVDTLIFVSWYKLEGEAVRQGEPLFVVETDKATLDVEAPASGILRQVTAKAGDEVQTLSTIATIAAEVGEVEATTEENLPLRLFASPRARRLAERENVPLTALSGTGPEGAVVERDVRAVLAQATAKTEEAPSITPVARRMAEEAGIDWNTLAGSGARGQVIRHDVESALSSRLQQATVDVALPLIPSAEEGFESIPLSGVRAIIAERMAQSHSQTAPVTLTAETDATELVEMRQRLGARDIGVSYNDLLIFILGRALRDHPRLNASLDGEQIKLWRRIDIGLAVDTDRGLLVPVVRNADQKGLAQLAAETKHLAEQARSGKITPDLLRGGTFTLTNLGMLGIDAFTPIVNLPETAILGVGRIKEKPAVHNGQVAIRHLMWLSLTFDHRLVDGGLAARFLGRVVELVESPYLLLA
jgi:pyruvate dehydrogenase E2 component (dihydrolipoamide acetyltransferase)